MWDARSCSLFHSWECSPLHGMAMAVPVAMPMAMAYAYGYGYAE